MKVVVEPTGLTMLSACSISVGMFDGLSPVAVLESEFSNSKCAVLNCAHQADWREEESHGPRASSYSSLNNTRFSLKPVFVQRATRHKFVLICSAGSFLFEADCETWKTCLLFYTQLQAMITVTDSWWVEALYLECLTVEEIR